jgi:hypothetical protein
LALGVLQNCVLHVGQGSAACPFALSHSSLASPPPPTSPPLQALRGPRRLPTKPAIQHLLDRAQTSRLALAPRFQVRVHHWGLWGRRMGGRQAGTVPRGARPGEHWPISSIPGALQRLPARSAISPRLVELIRVVKRGGEAPTALQGSTASGICWPHKMPHAVAPYAPWRLLHPAHGTPVQLWKRFQEHRAPCPRRRRTWRRMARQPTAGQQQPHTLRALSRTPCVLSLSAGHTSHPARTTHRISTATCPAGWSRHFDTNKTHYPRQPRARPHPNKLAAAAANHQPP